MGISNLWGLISLISIPIILILFMFRPRHQLKEVPSNYLWSQIIEDLSSARKFEKLKKSILLLLDILIAIIITLILIGIFFLSNERAQHQILIIDASFSMNSTDIQPSRLEEAKKLASEYIYNLKNKNNTKISLVVLRENPDILFKMEEASDIVISGIKEIHPSFSYTDVESINEAIKSIGSLGDDKIIYFGDKGLDFAENIVVKKRDDNLAISQVSSKTTEGFCSLLVEVKNESTSIKDVEISIYDKDLYLETKTVKVEAGSSKPVFFEDLSPDIRVYKAQIENKDSNPHDNTAYEFLSLGEKKKLALVSNGHYFLEKYLNLRDDIEVYSLNPAEYVDLSGYDIYIFDSFFPEILPTDGNLLVLDPPEDSENQTVKSLGYIENPDFEINSHPANSFLERSRFDVALSQVFENSVDILPIYSVPQGNLAYSGRINKQKIIVFGFDFRYTSLPLKAEFPIMMDNIISYISNPLMTGKIKYSAGENVEISILPSSESASLIDPSNEEQALDVNKTKVNFDRTDKLGLYKIVQNNSSEANQGSVSSYFIVNPPKFNPDDEASYSFDGALEDFRSRSDVNRFLFMILIALLLLELYVRMRPLALKTKA